MKFLTGTLLLAALILSANAVAGEPETVVAPVAFRFSGGEKIRLIVVPDPGAASLEQIVSDDGYIALPIGEPVNIKNKSLFEAYKLINDQIEKSSGARKVSASIALLSIPARYVYVGGEGLKASMGIQLPGGTPLTLYAAILAAGGVTPDGDPTQVSVTRTSADGKVKSEMYDVSGFGSASNKSLGPILEHGDVVRVPRGEVYVLAGEVSKPGVLTRRELSSQPGKELRVSSAIYATGGLKPNANRGSVKVIRTLKDGRKITLPVDLDAAEKSQGAPAAKSPAGGIPAELFNTQKKPETQGNANPGVGAPVNDTAEADPLLQDGDVIVVGATGTVGVLGRVRQPGVFPLNGATMKLTRALTMAGGFAEFAKTSSVVIVKAKGHQCLQVDLSKMHKNDFIDPELEDGDLVLVSERLL